MKTKRQGASKRYGPRYGRRLRQKVETVEAMQKTAYQCPFCHKNAVKRMAVGIWQCPKCAAVFTGKAYTLPKKASVEAETKQELTLETPEEGEEFLEEEQEEEVQADEQQSA